MKTTLFKTPHVFRTTSPSCVFKVYMPSTIYLQKILTYRNFLVKLFPRNQIRDITKPFKVLENLKSIKTVTITSLKSQCSFVFNIVAFYFCFELLQIQLIKKPWKVWCGISIFSLNLQYVYTIVKWIIFMIEYVKYMNIFNM